MIQVCHFHGDADDVTGVALDAGATQYTCVRDGHLEPGPYTWVSSATGDDLSASGGDGVMEEYGLYDALVKAVAASPAWVEYGVVEYRYSQAQPDTYRELVKHYGHTNLGPKNYTASSLMGGCLGLLANSRGELVHLAAPSTGYWSYNNPGSYYILNTGPVGDRPPTNQRETYADLAGSLGEDSNSVTWWPGVWTQ